MSLSTPVIQHALRHLFALICSVMMLFLLSFVVAPLYGPIFKLAHSFSAPSTGAYWHISSIAAFEWPILLLLIITVQMISRRMDTRRFWVWLSLLTLSFLLIGFAYWSAGNWAGLQSRQYAAIVTTLTHGLHTGIQAALYWIAYVFGVRLFQQYSGAPTELTGTEITA